MKIDPPSQNEMQFTFESEMPGTATVFVCSMILFHSQNGQKVYPVPDKNADL